MCLVWKCIAFQRPQIQALAAADCHSLSIEWQRSLKHFVIWCHFKNAVLCLKLKAWQKPKVNSITFRVHLGLALTNGFWWNWMLQLYIWSNILGLSLKPNWIIANYSGIFVKVVWNNVRDFIETRIGPNFECAVGTQWSVVFHFSSLREWSNVELLHFVEKGQRSFDLFVFALVCHHGMSLNTLPQKQLELIVSQA